MNHQFAAIIGMLLLLLAACAQPDSPAASSPPTDSATIITEPMPAPVQTSRRDVSAIISPTSPPSQTTPTASTDPITSPTPLAMATDMNDESETAQPALSLPKGRAISTRAPTPISLMPTTTPANEYEYLLDPLRPYPAFDIAVLENNDRLKFLNVYANW